MDMLVTKIVDEMLMEKILADRNRDLYIYTLQMIFEKVIGYAAIFLLAILFRIFLPTILFIIFFGSIRKYAGGFHFNYFLSCFIMSIAVYIVMSKLVYPIMPTYSIISLVWVVAAGIVIITIGAVNNDNIHWTRTEFKETKELSRYITLLEVGVIICMFFLQCKSIYLWFMSFGVLLAALFLLVDVLKNGILKLLNI